MHRLTKNRLRLASRRLITGPLLAYLPFWASAEDPGSLRLHVTGHRADDQRPMITICPSPETVKRSPLARPDDLCAWAWVPERWSVTWSGGCGAEAPGLLAESVVLEVLLRRLLQLVDART